MDDSSSSHARADRHANAARDHTGRFKRPAAPRNSVDHVIRLLAPDDRPETLIALFDGRASYHTIRSWRKRARAPQWAVDLLRQKKAAELAAIAQMETGPGYQAGWNNLGAYRAARNSER